MDASTFWNFVRPVLSRTGKLSPLRRAQRPLSQVHSCVGVSIDHFGLFRRTEQNLLRCTGMNIEYSTKRQSCRTALTQSGCAGSPDPQHCGWTLAITEICPGSARGLLWRNMVSFQAFLSGQLWHTKREVRGNSCFWGQETISCFSHVCPHFAKKKPWEMAWFVTFPELGVQVQGTDLIVSCSCVALWKLASFSRGRTKVYNVHWTIAGNDWVSCISRFWCKSVVRQFCCSVRL